MRHRGQQWSFHGTGAFSPSVHCVSPNYCCHFYGHTNPEERGWSPAYGQKTEAAHSQPPYRSVLPHSHVTVKGPQMTNCKNKWGRTWAAMLHPWTRGPIGYRVTGLCTVQTPVTSDYVWLQQAQLKLSSTVRVWKWKSHILTIIFR